MMVELKVGEHVYMLNTDNIEGIRLGDASVPSSKALSVTILFVSGKVLTFGCAKHVQAKRLYERIKRFFKPLVI